MRILDFLKRTKLKPKQTHFGEVQVKQHNIVSEALERNVFFEVYLPFEYNPSHTYDLLLLNDGQDLKQMDFAFTLGDLMGHEAIRPLIAVGIYCNERRIREYGTADHLDYKGRGDLAGKYTAFVVNELLPWLHKHFNISHLPAHRCFAGFSMGALSALDIAWARPDLFGNIGVFSGSLWWRHTEVDPAGPDDGRIIHQVVGDDRYKPGMRFWFQAGTLDEEEDRNNNGIIDAIDDTLDLMRTLVDLGYNPDTDITYVQVEGGRHDQATWAGVMPDFLHWVFGQKA